MILHGKNHNNTMNKAFVSFASAKWSSACSLYRRSSRRLYSRHILCSPKAFSKAAKICDRAGVKVVMELAYDLSVWHEQAYKLPLSFLTIQHTMFALLRVSVHTTFLEDALDHETIGPFFLILLKKIIIPVYRKVGLALRVCFKFRSFRFLESFCVLATAFVLVSL